MTGDISQALPPPGPMADIVIRTLSREDLGDHMARFIAVGGDVDSWAAANFLMDLPGKWDLSFAAWADGPVGYAILSRKGPGHIHLHHLMVRRDLRGRHLGDRLLSEVETRAGSARLTLKVEKGNEAVVRFYRRHGFRLTDTSGDYWWMERRHMTGDGKTVEKGALGRRLAEDMAEVTLEKIGALGIENAGRNQGAITAGKSILALRETALAEGDSALIIAAGPSLHRADTAAMIKESGFEGIIIATESSMSWCLRNGIHPDLTVTVDPHPDRIVRWFGDPGLDAEALARDDYFTRQDMDPRFRADQLDFNRRLLELIDREGPKLKIAVASSASEAVVRRATEAGMGIYWWNPFYDDYDREGSLTRQVYEMNRLPCLNAGGNVGTACWVIAHAILGKTKVGLLGMDFGYYGDTTYKETQYYYELIDLVGEENLDKVFVHFHNPFVDKEFFTDPAYLWYRAAFLEMAGMAAGAGIATYNCTGGGILFGEGVTFASLQDFVDGSKR